MKLKSRRSRIVGIPTNVFWKRLFEVIILSVTCSHLLTGCSNKFNQTGAWIVGTDNSVLPRTFVSDTVKVSTTQVNIGLPNGSDTVLCLGSVPWSEADLLLEFGSLDSVYYASKIISAQVVLGRASYTLQPYGYDVHNLQFEGYAIDSSWNTSTFTWDSISRLPRGGSNIITSPVTPAVSDSEVILQIDSSVVRRWANATQDTNIKNYGFIVKPMNVSGALSVYSTAYSGTGHEPTIVVACIINGISDTVRSTSSYTTYVATTSIVPPPKTFVIQSGTGLHGNIVFDLSKIPNYSIVNNAQLTIFGDRIDTLYSGGSPDSLYAYYQSDPSTHARSLSGIALSSLDSVSRDKYTFSVTVLVQQMLNLGNNGFIITRNEDYNNLDPRFIYNENAPDSLRPRLTITYAPAVKKK